VALEVAQRLEQVIFALAREPGDVLAALDHETRDWVKGPKTKPAAHVATRMTVSPLTGTWPGPSITRREWTSGRPAMPGAGRWQMARRAEFRTDRSENQQAWLCCSMATPAREPSDLLFPSRGRGLMPALACAMLSPL